MNQLFYGRICSLITLEDAARRKLIDIGNKNKSDVLLKIMSGGCSGLSYNFELFDGRTSAYEYIILGSGVKLYIAPEGYEYIKECTIKWNNSLVGEGFAFDNPSAESSCGCGVSFTPKF